MRRTVTSARVSRLSVSCDYDNMFLSKVQQSYCHTQFCNYREEFVFKPISNQLNILVGCNLRFTGSLNTFYLEIGG